MRINNIPSPTWRWLKLNYTEFDTGVEIKKSSGSNKKAMKQLAEIPTGLGEEVAGYFSTGDIKVIMGDDAKLEYRLSAKNEAHTVVISVPDNGSATVTMMISGDASGLFGLRTIYAVGKGATLNLSQVFLGGKNARVLNDLGGAVDDEGCFNLQQIFLDGAEIYAGDYTYLHGRKSSFNCDIAYRTKGSGILDMNYVADHTGKKSSCDIKVNGVLFDSARKLFRGTIDFKRGCAGATGAEIEDVLLMNEGVRNQTIPVILCREEDVEGAHGATIGKLDEGLLFYMTSRGMSLDDIYKMMSTARIDALRRRLYDRDAAALVGEYLNVGE